MAIGDKKAEFGMLYDRDLLSRVTELIKESSKFKQIVFNGLLMENPISKVSVKYFLSFVDEFLSFWEDFADDMQEKMKKITPHRTNTIPYQEIKDYIYAKYDYAAVLQFADGVIKLINENDTKADGIKDYFTHTASKAFDDRADSVGGLVNEVLMRNNSELRHAGAGDEAEVKMFNSVKSYGMFNSRDKVELYKAVQKTIEFITDVNMVNKYLRKASNRIYIDAVNYIIEFATYSMVAYATRIFMINAYAYPYIHNDRSDHAPISEANEINLPNTGIDIHGIEINVIREMDEAICKDINKLEEFINAFSKFSTMIGGDHLYGNNKPKYRSHMHYYCFNTENNALCSQLVGNDLYNLIVTGNGDYSSFNMKDSDVRELNTRLKDYVYNKKQGLQGTNSAKQEMLAVIRGLSCDKTVKGYQSLFADLFMGSATILTSLIDLVNSLITWNAEEVNNPKFILDTRTVCQENLRITTELYSELANAFIQKGREIESGYNNLNATEINKQLNLNVPGTKSNEIGTTSDITNAVPDTARVPIELTNLYTLPAFESLQYYDEMIKIKYNLEDDFYFSEAFNLSELINKIIAFIQGVGSKLDGWWNNPKLQAALNYATKNGSKIAAMDFTGQSMQVLPFKNNGNSENISLVDVKRSLINNLNNFNIKITEGDGVQNFIKSLYPNETVASWFDDENVGPKKFRNWVLYQNDVNSVNINQVTGITIEGEEIKKRVDWWIATCESGATMYKELKNIEKQLIASATTIKNKISSLKAVNTTNNVKDPGADNTNNQNNNGSQNQNNGQSGNGQNTGNGQGTGNGQNGTQGNNQQQDSNKQLSNCNILLNGINTVLTRIYRPVVDMCIFYITTEYRYLQEAYKLGEGNNQNTNQNTNNQ